MCESLLSSLPRGGRKYPAVDRQSDSRLLPATVAAYAVVAHAGDWVAQRFFTGHTSRLLTLGRAWPRRCLACVGEDPQVAGEPDSRRKVTLRCGHS